MKLKLISAALAVALLLGLAGCGGDAPQTAAPSPTILPSAAPAATATPAPTPTPTPEPIEITPVYTTGRGDRATGLFTVTLPESWRDEYIVEFDETDTTYGLSFYQKAARDAGFGGWLFTLTSFPDGLYYYEYPQYELVGVLRGGGWDEHIVAIYPSDVQFDEPQRVQYGEMWEDIPAILASLRYDESVTFYPAGELQLWTYGWPEDYGLSVERLYDLREAIEPTGIRAFAIARDSVMVDEYYRDGFDHSSRFAVHSATKSVTATMLGVAIEQGYISPDLDRPISEYFPQIDPSSAWAKVTVRHLLTHTSGMSWNEYDENTNWQEWISSENWVDYVLSRPIVRTPGTFFNYTTGGTHLLGAIIEKATGRSLVNYADEYLFRPMGITDYEWTSDPQGVTDGGNGLHLTLRDMAKFGQLMLQRGAWNGEQLVPSEWVDECTSVQYRRSGRFASYGYQFWIKDFGGYETFFAQGFGGQLIFVQPELGLVCAMASTGSSDTHAPWSYFENYVLAAIE